MLIKHLRWAALNVKELSAHHGAALRPCGMVALTASLCAVKVFEEVEGGLWTLTLTVQLPFTENASPFCAIKNIIFLPANFLC